jgi:predicted RNase H-like nuclease (RuvC/YqgF family)
MNTTEFNLENNDSIIDSTITNGSVPSSTPLSTPNGKNNKNKKKKAEQSPESLEDSLDIDKLNEVITSLQDRIATLEKRLKEKDDIITILMVNKSDSERKHKETNKKIELIDQKLINHEEYINNNKKKVDFLISDRTLLDKVKDMEVMIKNVPSNTSSVK